MNRVSVGGNVLFLYSGNLPVHFQRRCATQSERLSATVSLIFIVLLLVFSLSFLCTQPLHGHFPFVSKALLEFGHFFSSFSKYSPLDVVLMGIPLNRWLVQRTDSRNLYLW